MMITVPIVFDRYDEEALAIELKEEMDVRYQSVVHMSKFIKDVVRANLDNLREVHGVGPKEKVQIKVKVRKR